MQSEQAQRHNAGKPQLSYLLDAPHAMNAVCRVLEFGAEKYARNNWKKGMPWSSIMDSLLRHLMALKAGEDLDPESGLPHVGHILCNAVFLAEYFELRPEFDDRDSENAPVLTPEDLAQWGFGPLANGYPDDFPGEQLVKE